MWVFIFAGAGAPLLGVSLARVRLYRGLYPRDRPDRRADGAPLGLYEAAYLERGRRGVAELALCALYLGGRLTVDDDGRIAVVRGAGGPEDPDPVQAAVLVPPAGTPPPHAREVAARVADGTAVADVERRLVERGLAVDPRRRGRTESAELGQTVCLLVAMLATVAACITESATGQGTGLRPFLAFAALGVVTGLVTLLAGPVIPHRHATAAGQRRARDAAADGRWAPPLPPGALTGTRHALTGVARDGPGSAAAPALAPLAAHLRPVPGPRAPSPAANEPPSVGGCGAGCGGGCGGGI
ncbi:TIGR04222 domain-containing membrane protein [Streptomyces sp. NPDC002138]|uniref:TIGR04222 domain-containing membrane protein n=1 Tax=Streptomyces sp. NPDC002138 TaxID=3154410 RepID=UPI003319F7E2